MSPTPKSGTERTVDMADTLATHLKALELGRREAALREGQPMSEWVVFPWLPETPKPTDAARAKGRLRRAMARTLKSAALPPHFTPHSARHTFCTLLIAAGVSPVYVQQQVGHSDVSLTVRVYGSWFPVKQPSAVNDLAGERESKVVTKRAQSGNSPSVLSPQALPSIGAYALRDAGTHFTPAKGRSPRSPGASGNGLKAGADPRGTGARRPSAQARNPLRSPPGGRPGQGGGPGAAPGGCSPPATSRRAAGGG